LVALKPQLGATVKLNVDGSYLGNPDLSGFKYLIKDTNDNWLFGFSNSCGITTNMIAKLQAIFHNFQMVWNNGFQHVKCELDCQSTLTLIKEGVLTTHPYAPVINLIKIFINYP
jgi:ribonuclease HI